MNTPTYASASLYVGDLLPDITETQLFDVFKQVGPVASIRVCRDAVTRRSLGYAYVNYHNLADAERAVDLLNYKEIRGKQCRIMWSQRDPGIRKSGTTNLFIKNLDKKIDNKALYDKFSPFGNILSCKVAADDLGNSKGFGFIHFESKESADRAVEECHDKPFGDKVIFVGYFQSRKDRVVDQDVLKKYTNVFIKNLSKTVSDEGLMEMFGKYGKITNAAIMRDQDGSSKGFAFINFETAEEAQKAVDEMNGKDIDGVTLYAGRAQKKAERERELKQMFEKIKRERMSKYQGVNLYVKNLDEGVDDEKLRQEFSQCGTITSTKVMKEEKGGSKGFGFVCFATPEEATKAVTEMNGKLINNKPVYVALAQRKDQRRQQLEAQYAQRSAAIRMEQQAQASGMTGHPLYTARTPAWYPQPRPGFVYPPGQMMPRGRIPNARPFLQPGAPPGAFVVQPIQGKPPGQKSSRGGKGSGQRGQSMSGANRRGGYPGIKYNPNVRNQQQPAQVETTTPSVAETTEQPEKKLQIGDSLFQLISDALKLQGKENQSGKITGMLLESLSHEELLGLLESQDALNKKIAEAFDVLEEFSKTQAVKSD